MMMRRVAVILFLCALAEIVQGKELKEEEAHVAKSRQKRAFISGPLIGIIASAVNAGASLVATTLKAAMTTGMTVSIGLTVDNWTKWILADPTITLYRGEVRTPPHSVLPGEEELMVAHKTPGLAYGSGGVLTFTIRELSKNVHIMWYVSNNQNFYTNWMAVGISDSTQKYTFKQMYYRPHNGFTRGQFYYKIIPISYTDTALGITVHGTMGTSHMTKGSVIIKPESLEDLAPKLKKAAEKKIKAEKEKAELKVKAAV